MGKSWGRGDGPFHQGWDIRKWTTNPVPMMLGQADAWFWIFFAIARISVFSIVVSFLLFRKKELDF